MHERLMSGLWRRALDFRVDVRYWDIDLLSYDQQTRERAKPQPYILAILDFLSFIGGRRIVEIGTMRHAMSASCVAYASPGANPFDASHCCNDGHSTYFWARPGHQVHSVDIDPSCREQVVRSYSNLGEPLPPGLHLHNPCDGIDFLSNHRETIDFLYLDGWDKGTPGYAERHLEAYQQARRALAPVSIVAIDDTDFRTPSGGKEALVVPALLADGYLPLLRGRVCVFARARKASLWRDLADFVLPPSDSR